MTNTKCPCCWQPAYLGFLHIECATKDCRNFSSKMLDTPAAKENNSEFKVGDRIRIIKPRAGGSSYGFLGNRYIGVEATIYKKYRMIEGIQLWELNNTNDKSRSVDDCFCHPDWIEKVVC